MNTLICAGGTGARVLEAVVHLCAAGLGPETLRVLVIDPDDSNGNMTDTRKILGIYNQMHDAFFGSLGEEEALFRTKLQLLPSGDGDLQVWSPVTKGDALKDLLKHSNLPAGSTCRDVVKLLYTDAEITSKLDVGFLGHPSIGAAALSTMNDNERTWKELKNGIRQDVAGVNGGRVLIVGSVFGGTGAAAIHPVARFVRDMPETNKEKLTIGVCAVAPYFRFDPPKGEVSADEREMRAKAEEFPLATRAAVQFYQHLRENDDWPFDCLFWIGDNGPMKVGVSKGGSTQRNPAHFVELVSAIAAMEFFGVQEPIRTGSCYYTGPRPEATGDAALESSNLLEWNDIPCLGWKNQGDIRRGLLRFGVLGAAHLGFFGPLFEDGALPLDTRSYCIPWYKDLLTNHGDSLLTDKASKKEKADKADKTEKLGNTTLRERMTAYFRDYFVPWLREVNQQEAGQTPVRLFNAAALSGEKEEGKKDWPIDLARLANLLHPDEEAKRADSEVDAFVTEVERACRSMAYGGTGGMAAYVALLAQASRRYIHRKYPVVRN